MKKWEYKVFTPDETPGRSYRDCLDELGFDGWELVSVTGESKFELTAFYLKREVVED